MARIEKNVTIAWIDRKVDSLRAQIKKLLGLKDKLLLRGLRDYSRKYVRIKDAFDDECWMYVRSVSTIGSDSIQFRGEGFTYSITKWKDETWFNYEGTYVCEIKVRGDEFDHKIEEITEEEYENKLFEAISVIKKKHEEYQKEKKEAPVLSVAQDL